MRSILRTRLLFRWNNILLAYNCQATNTEKIPQRLMADCRELQLLFLFQRQSSGCSDCRSRKSPSPHSCPSRFWVLSPHYPTASLKTDTHTRPGSRCQGRRCGRRIGYIPNRQCHRSIQSLQVVRQFPYNMGYYLSERNLQKVVHNKFYSYPLQYTFLNYSQTQILHIVA